LTIMLDLVAPGLRIARSSIRLGPGFELPLACSVVTLSTGGLALISPVAFDDASAAEVDALGPVEHIIAPNLLHHLHVASAMRRWPGAQAHGAPGLAAKRGDVGWATVLGEAPIDGDLQAVALHGAPGVSEVALFHAPSRALILTDLVFNVHGPRGWLTPFVLRMMGAPAGSLAQSRAWRFLFVKDRAAASASARALVALRPEILVVAHGEPIERDASAKLERALSWMLGAAPVAALPASRA
jgi:hypothetical protein